MYGFTSPQFESSSSHTLRETVKNKNPNITINLCSMVHGKPFSVCLTLIGIARLWFHWGLAFFSKILVQTWKIIAMDFRWFVIHWNTERFILLTVKVTVFPAKWISTNGSTKFFLLVSNPRICLIPSMKASSTGQIRRSVLSLSL